MDLDQGVHAPVMGGVDKVRGGFVIELSHDDEDTIGTPGAGFDDLVGIKHEVLA